MRRIALRWRVFHRSDEISLPRRTSRPNYVIRYWHFLPLLRALFENSVSDRMLHLVLGSAQIGPVSPNRLDCNTGQNQPSLYALLNVTVVICLRLTIGIAKDINPINVVYSLIAHSNGWEKHLQPTALIIA